ncbi:MAG: GAF domain-containing protein [Janthinobacterium lividum]
MSGKPVCEDEGMAMNPERDTRFLQMADLQELAMTLRDPRQPGELFGAVETLTARVIGHRLFTIMAFDPATFEVERLYSNRPDLYPPGGRKKKGKTVWGEHVLVQRKVFRATTNEGIRRHFDDHQKLAEMGLGAILNIPIAYDGRCLGTMNLTHVGGWYCEAHEAMGLAIGSFLVAALLEHRRHTIGAATPRDGVAYR